MNRLARTLVVFVIVFHVAIFVLEAFLWMRPAIYEPALNRLSSTPALALHEQALILKALYVNQGFYNLFLAIAGISGLVFLNRGRAAAGYALTGYMCLSAVGAGVVLAGTTTAYIGAFLQAVPAALALAAMARSYQGTVGGTVGA